MSDTNFTTDSTDSWTVAAAPEKALIPQIEDNIAECFKTCWSISRQISRVEETVTLSGDEKGEEEAQVKRPVLVEIANNTYDLKEYLEALLERVTIANNKALGEP